MRISDIPFPTGATSPRFPSTTLRRRALILSTASRSRRRRIHCLKVVLWTISNIEVVRNITVKPTVVGLRRPRCSELPQRVGQDFRQVACPAAGAVLDLLAAGDAHHRHLPVGALGVDLPGTGPAPRWSWRCRSVLSHSRRIRPCRSSRRWSVPPCSQVPTAGRSAMTPFRQASAGGSGRGTGPAWPVSLNSMFRLPSAFSLARNSSIRNDLAGHSTGLLAGHELRVLVAQGQQAARLAADDWHAVCPRRRGAGRRCGGRWLSAASIMPLEIIGRPQQGASANSTLKPAASSSATAALPISG